MSLACQVLVDLKLIDLMDKAEMPHAARAVQSKEAVRCPRTNNAFSIIWLTTVVDTVLSPELPELRSRMRHPSFYCALLLLHTIFICFEEKDFRSQSMTSESISWVLADNGAKHCCILLVGSLLMICLNGRSQSSVLLWNHCTGFFGGSFLHLEQRRGEVRISGCHFRVEITFWVTYQDAKPRKPWQALYVGAAPYHHLKYLISQRA